MEATEKIELGDLAKEQITGFEGIVIAHAAHLYNCNRVAIQPRELKDGQPQKTNWFDVTHVSLLEKGVLAATPAEEHTFNLGDEVQDTLIPSFRGKITSFATYLSGCVRAAIQPDALKDGLPVDETFMPVQQLSLVKKTEIPEERKPGGPMRDPQGVRDPR